MNPQDAIDFSREAIMTCMKVGGPILVVSLVIGMLVGVFQAMTQIQDQTVSFVPKILLLLVMIGLCLPWLSDQMLDFAKQSFETPMTHWEGSQHADVDFSSPTDTLESPGNHSTEVEPPIVRPVIGPTTTLPPNTAQVTIPSQMIPVSKASFVSEPIPQADSIQIQPVPVQQADQSEPGQSPFILPHYRFTRLPESDIDG